tara:strand:+ start:618 stop:1016 length:399 start_codon:yes stop_codon:yes gene_type:complete
MLTTRRNYNHPTTFLFDDLFGDLLALETPKIKSSGDVYVRDLGDAHEISVAAPGLKKEDFKVNLEGTTLSVSYERNKEDLRFLSKKSFSKSWQVSKGLTEKDIAAKYDAGVLVLTVKKPESEIVKAHTIEVQ